MLVVLVVAGGGEGLFVLFGKILFYLTLIKCLVRIIMVSLNFIVTIKG